MAALWPLQLLCTQTAACWQLLLSSAQDGFICATCLHLTSTTGRLRGTMLIIKETQGYSTPTQPDAQHMAKTTNSTACTHCWLQQTYNLANVRFGTTRLLLSPTAAR
jgi:hypothetical protein